MDYIIAMSAGLVIGGLVGWIGAKRRYNRSIGFVLHGSGGAAGGSGITSQPAFVGGSGGATFITAGKGGAGGGGKTWVK